MTREDKIEEAFTIVFTLTRITKEQLKSKSRLQPLAHARHLFCYIMRKHYLDGLYPFTLKDIGKEIGGRHHSTILSSLQELQDLCDSDEEVRLQVAQAVSMVSDYAEPLLRQKNYSDFVSDAYSELVRLYAITGEKNQVVLKNLNTLLRKIGCENSEVVSLVALAQAS
jgi:hypothetical protein